MTNTETSSSGSMIITMTVIMTLSHSDVDWALPKQGTLCATTSLGQGSHDWF